MHARSLPACPLQSMPSCLAPIPSQSLKCQRAVMSMWRQRRSKKVWVCCVRTMHGSRPQTHNNHTPSLLLEAPEHPRASVRRAASQSFTHTCTCTRAAQWGEGDLWPQPHWHAPTVWPTPRAFMGSRSKLCLHRGASPLGAPPACTSVMRPVTEEPRRTHASKGPSLCMEQTRLRYLNVGRVGMCNTSARQGAKSL